jgi:hypothetical protein
MDRLRSSASSRHKFTSAEDSKLRDLVTQLGTKSWEEIAKYMAGRTARQCRDRYKNYLLDSLVTAPWTAEEDAIIAERYRQLGPKWVEIAKMLNGRSGNHVKNRWHRHLGQQDGFSVGAVSPDQVDSGDQSSDWEESAREEVPTVLLCPELNFAQRDWARLFDKMDETLGYGSGTRAK